MAFNISEGTFYRVMDCLGYTYIGDSPVLPTFTTEIEAQQTETNIVNILDDIDNTLEQIKNLLPDSLAVKLGTLTVDYAQQYRLLVAHGIRQTKRLSIMIHLPVRVSYFNQHTTSAFK